MIIKYFKNDGCKVCQTFLPKVEKIAKNYNLTLEIVDVVQKPEIAGQSLVFTVPTVVFYDLQGNEIKRFARNFSELEIREYVERIYGILDVEK
ncbi:MAG: thioredoxin family protein [Fervidobacterium sp.]|nr:thioredoxin family protein [Fervidobacterium sp.]